jgi:outer membrane protein TolC
MKRSNRIKHSIQSLSAVAVLLILLMAICPDGRADELKISWKECVAITVDKNPDLKSSRELIIQSKAKVGSAISGYLPRISANMGATVNRQTSQDQTTQKITTNVNQMLVNEATRNKWDDSYSYSYGISGKQMIFDGFKTVFDIKSAESLVDQSKYRHQATSSDIRLSLRAAYVNLMKSQESIGLLRQIANRWKRNLDLVTMRYRAGREHRGSVLNAEATLAQARLELQQAERGLRIAQMSLLRQMGIPVFMPVSSEDKLTGNKTDADRPDFAAILKKHPLVLQAAKLRESAEYGQKSSIAAFSPVISATGSAGKSDSKFPAEKTSLSAGLDVSVPIFSGGSDYFNYRTAESQSRKLAADEQATREQVMLDLENKWNDWQNSIGQSTVRRKFVEAAEERSRIAESQYSIGLILFDNWIIIENELAQARKNYLDALASELVAEAAWIQAQGETLSYDN